jgi:hypothetical protein
MKFQKYIPLAEYDLSYTAPIPLPWNPTIYCFIAAFSAVPMWMSIELTFQIFATFKRHTGLYFYSLMFCTWSITIRQVGRICIYFVPGCNQIFSLVFAMLGWVGTVTGFAVVLYSRLHLVTRNRILLRSILCMIIFSVFAFHLTTMIAQIGVVTKHQPRWISWYPAMEKMQIVGFTVQEIIISTIYIFHTHKLLGGSYNETTRKSIRLLIIVQVLCVALDIPFIVLAFADIFLIKATLTSFAAPMWRRASITPKHPLAAHQNLPKPAEKCIADMLDQKPTPALPAVPVIDVNMKNRSSPSTFNDSMLTTSSNNTDVISRPHLSRQRTDNSFADIEKRYLGQYGIRTMRAP